MLPVRYEWEERTNVLISAHMTISHFCPLEFFLLKNLWSKFAMMKNCTTLLDAIHHMDCIMHLCLALSFCTRIHLLLANDGIHRRRKKRYGAGITVRKHQTCFQTSKMLFVMSFRPMTCESNPDCSMKHTNEKWTLYLLNISISQQVAISISSLTMFSASFFLFRNWSVFRHDRMSHSAGRPCSLSLISTRLTSHLTNKTKLYMHEQFSFVHLCNK